MSEPAERYLVHPGHDPSPDYDHTPEPVMHYRHRSCANALFADWHVERLLKKKVLVPGMAVQDNGGEVQWNPERDESNAPLE